jgi:hypothetical protein
MATYGRGQMLGSGINPESFKLDYSGFANAAATQAQGVSDLGASIGGVIKEFGEAKEQRKKIDAETKASRAGIESAIKLGDALGFDVKGMLSPVLDRMDDPNTTPMEAAALGREASTQIANVLNLGFKAQDQESQRASLMQDAAYKDAQLRISQQNADARTAAGTKFGSIENIAVPGGTQQMVRNPETGVLEPIQISGSNNTTTSSLGNLPDALKPYAKDFETAGAKYGVPPIILAGISMHETGNGTSSAFRNKNNAMGISNASGPVEVGSVAESIDKMARLLGKGINEGTGPYANAKSIADIANIYAPPGAGNDPRNLNQFWTQGVTSNIQKLSENKAEQVEPTAEVNQGRIGFTAEKVEPVERAMTDAERITANLPAGQYMARFTGDKPSNIKQLETPPDSLERLKENRMLKADERISAVIESTDKGGERLISMNEALSLLNSGEVKSGSLESIKVAAKRLLGMDVASEEQFNSLVGNLAMEAIDLTKGAISDKEMAFFRQELAPGINKSVDGNKKIIEFKIAAAKRGLRINQIARDMLANNALPADIEAAIKKIQNEESLIPSNTTDQSTPNKPQSAADRLRALPPAQ